ncbi:hypothetical protein HK100_008953 [Physocladia obscura]|uniref:Uncharacterized protein n=1 Tax=Physocladia obscura TaxID=109957 RepID=A0AAD5X671_9FUNG|nr:hypothetical protein HK100_008953 [Physocladia obscura]
MGYYSLRDRRDPWLIVKFEDELERTFTLPNPTIAQLVDEVSSRELLCFRSFGVPPGNLQLSTNLEGHDVAVDRNNFLTDLITDARRAKRRHIFFTATRITPPVVPHIAAAIVNDAPAIIPDGNHATDQFDVMLSHE